MQKTCFLKLTKTRHLYRKKREKSQFDLPNRAFFQHPILAESPVFYRPKLPSRWRHLKNTIFQKVRVFSAKKIRPHPLDMPPGKDQRSDNTKRTLGPSPYRENRPKRLPKSIKKGIQNMMQVRLEFGALLGRFLVDDGKQPPAH